MNTELKALIHDAEDHYLQSPELNQLNAHLDSLAKRLAAYESLRDCEAEVFQEVADDLQSAFPRLDSQLLIRALEDGLSILRYSAMAMLQNDPKYLQRQLLEWLPSRVQAYELEAVEDSLLQLLKEHLGKRIVVAQMVLIQPYLDRVRHTLTGDRPMGKSLISNNVSSNSIEPQDSFPPDSVKTPVDLVQAIARSIS